MDFLTNATFFIPELQAIAVMTSPRDLLVLRLRVPAMFVRVGDFLQILHFVTDIVEVKFGFRQVQRRRILEIENFRAVVSERP